jgi:hypothetical protein
MPASDLRGFPIKEMTMSEWIVAWTCPPDSLAGERDWEKFDDEESAHKAIEEWRALYPENNYIAYVRAEPRAELAASDASE